MMKVQPRVLTISVLMLSVFAAGASPSPSPPSVYRSLNSVKAHNAAAVSGTLDAIDYSAGTLVVRTAHGSQTVSVIPSTSIYAGSGYAALSDLRRGQSVEIAVYEVGGRLVAQTIRVKTP
jgi:hypothetical protein